MLWKKEYANAREISFYTSHVEMPHLLIYFMTWASWDENGNFAFVCPQGEKSNIFSPMLNVNIPRSAIHDFKWYVILLFGLFGHDNFFNFAKKKIVFSWANQVGMYTIKKNFNSVTSALKSWLTFEKMPLKNRFWVQNWLTFKFSNYDVLQKGLLLQDCLFIDWVLNWKSDSYFQAWLHRWISSLNLLVHMIMFIIWSGSPSPSAQSPISNSSSKNKQMIIITEPIWLFKMTIAKKTGPKYKSILKVMATISIVANIH